ncbi:hypothetical protein LTR70_010044 [Exophiala xenobiotica]|uniref:Nucleoside phosphorylase domain-containing protein n=1 Tax=Lithohypha guttulata TaxID=1690604 RepID=A0ABR0JVQ9_9EURO|nr:hypothetical protein LTR24_009932 [Lithohypha guttulata]KAK5309732.1 hypothetical protein LTR70_010044 [Exophiala xenobiotica]
MTEQAKPQPPKDRSGFTVAIICALTLESSAVEALLDDYYDENDHHYGKASGDPNTYTLGRIGRHNVVLAYMPGMGQINSTTVAAHFNKSFPKIRLGLVAGICGGVPQPPDAAEIFLGDVIISTGLVQIDFGRQLVNGIQRKDTLDDNLGRPNTEIRGFLGHLQGYLGRKNLRSRVQQAIKEVLEIDDFKTSPHPAPETDQLYVASYRHKHRIQGEGTCIVCDACIGDNDSVCDVALKASCTDLGCNRIVQRIRPAVVPQIFFGKLAESNQVMKSSLHRDNFAKEEKVLGYEMEGAGVWDNFPTIVIKGVCDYADSHKNKTWQPYAALTGAATAKAVLLAWSGIDEEAATPALATNPAASPPPQVNTATAARAAPRGGHIFSGNFNAGRDQNVGNVYDYGNRVEPKA